ncbi:endonuclease-reverse transcriptase [Elysia marginata]|uniref:Endonuclease-reverse transcriptase n=1 Tax=Elysia marginata TaxID=1093978 RepID=A0AAV4GUH2_9GAST|nr:endonuclease-reverse transcriptase [Elysia marginata]
MDFFQDGSKEDTYVRNVVLQETAPWTEKKNNEEVIQMADVGKRLVQQLKKRKLRYAGHINEGSSGPLLQLSIEGKIEWKRGQGRPRRNWMDVRNGQGR